MRHLLFLAWFYLLCLASCHTPSPTQPLGVAPSTAPSRISRIAFGSCAEQDKPQPVLDAALACKPDLFIYLGDNIYGDTEDMDKLQRKYGELAAKPEFQRLRAGTTVLATWDDHDYGANDAGRHYPKKVESKEIFLDFWQEPKESPRWKHPGIYHSLMYGEEAHRVQVILLDTRSFRDDLLLADGSGPWKNDYRPNPSPDSTMLGADQWAWLEQTLQEPAVFRIIASSNQFCHAYNGYESWTNVPREQERMLDLLRKTRAEGVVFISGDVHWGELSLRKPEGLYPLYDVTSSGITETWPKIEPNEFRVGEAEPANNFGLISIDWKEDPELRMELRRVDGSVRVGRVVRRSELGF